MGAIVPEGADYVINVENTETLPEDKVRIRGAAFSDNICF
jgi:molybdopterin biosynthesis enzyme